MSKKSLFLLLIPLFIVTFVHAQGETPARLRIMQLSYLPPSSAIIDIQLDDDLIFENVGFPFATDYVEVGSGEYMLTTMMSVRRRQVHQPRSCWNLVIVTVSS